MFKFKIIVASILALTSGMVFAEGMSSNNLRVSLTGLYLQPSFGGNGLGYNTYSNYAGADNQGVIVTNNGVNYINKVTPNWTPAFQLAAMYRLNAVNDISIDWSHLNETVHGHLPNGTLFSGSADGFYAGNINLNTQWDAVNLEAGQQVNLSDKKWVHLRGGLHLAKIKNTFTNFPKLFPNSAPYMTTNDEFTYSGIGPRVGIDFDWRAGGGFSFYTRFAGSLLVGTAKQAITGYRNVTNSNYGLIIFGIPNYNYRYNNVIVPEVEAKLGVAYNYQFAKSNLGVDLGYLWMNYLNAISSYTGIGIVGSSVGQPATTNFNLNGVYLGINWSGNI